MCGISGILSRVLPREEIRGRLEEMCSIQRHRGPDDAGLSVNCVADTQVGLGFVRLSILDLETGMQPITARDDGCSIVCNGQVYNYLELKEDLASEEFLTRGDIEVALHLYRRDGIEFLDSLNGMYAGAILDPRAKRVLLFRDRFGIKPLYYLRNSRGFFFSSEIKPLLAGSGTNPRLEDETLPVYFSYRYVPGERTMFRGVRRLPPGSFLVYDLENESFSVKRYWEYLPGSGACSCGDEEAEIAFMELVRDAVRIRMRSDVEVGSLVSGGIDSSSVASMAASSQPEIKLFTVSFDNSLYDELDDVKNLLASKNATFRSAELIHRTCSPECMEKLPELIGSVEDCISLGTILPTDQVCGLASEHVKVVLTGEGADEIFAGYRKFLLEMAAEEYSKLSENERKRLQRDFPELDSYVRMRDPDPARRFIQSEMLFSPGELTRLLGRPIDSVAFPEDAMPAVTSDMHPLNQLLAMECRSRLPDYVVLRLDKLSMRHSLETRTPYLDYRLAEFAAGLPVHLKVNLARRMGKYICRKSLSESGVVDSATANRGKKPFTIPMAAWLLERNIHPEFIQEILIGGSSPLKGLLDMTMVRSISGSITAQGIGPDTLISDADRVWALITFGLWIREFSA